MRDLQLPNDNKFVNKMLFWWFWLRALYLEYQKSKKVADAVADNEANKVKIAGEIEEKFIREQIQIIESLEQADKFIEYKNLYGVLTKAVPQITYMGDEERIDPDKMKRLKDLSKEFSSEEMQEYIAWILAWEYNQPWSYSLQTMSVIKNLSRDEINLFKKFSALIIDNNFVYTWIFSVGTKFHEDMTREGFLWGEFLYLQELWLFSSISTSNINWWNISIDIQKKLQKENKNIPMNYSIGWKDLLIGIDRKITFWEKKVLTKAWKELLNLIWYEYSEVAYQIIRKSLLNLWFKEVI